MSLWVMVAITVALVVLPFVLMLAFNRDDLTDSRGRRISRRWHH